MTTRARKRKATKAATGARKSPARRRSVAGQSAKSKRRIKNTGKLFGRFSLDFAAVRRTPGGSGGPMMMPAPANTADEFNPALMRLQALAERDAPAGASMDLAPVDSTRANWTALGPLAIPNGQTYGGARVLISGRVTAIAPHPTDGDTIFIGASRGGVWRTQDGGRSWVALGDDQPSLAIGALAIGVSDPNILYAGTGEGNVQLYSTQFALNSAPGVYLGVGVLRSTDGGATWTHHAATLLANHSFYRIAVDPADANRAFAATSRGLCRTTDGITWSALTGGGLPAISASVIACTDVVIDRADATGNTVYAAFWASGIYKSTNALAASPAFTKLTTGLPAGSAITRIGLAQSPSSPARVYALVASSGDAFKGLYRTNDAAATNWELCTSSATIELYGAFTNDVGVDPTTPDVVYVSGVQMYKCVRNAASGAWSVTNIGGNIHPDSHALGFHPTLNQTIYSGNDGGFYVSRDGGATWDDTPNEGLCLLQYEAVDNHGSSDAFMQCGTQDNGTQQYRNSPVHYHSADGDGGYCTVSKVNGNHVTHAYFGNTPNRSTSGGKFGSYSGVATGLNGSGLFYPPAAISPSSERIAWGTSVMNIDDAMGTGGWPGSGVVLPGVAGPVSAISFTSDTLIYCATTSGEVYRLDRSGTTWTARALHAAPLPTNQWIWDVHSVPGSPGTVVVCFSGFGMAQHVWRGTVPATGPATWLPVSNGLPDVPMYALAFSSAASWFVGTDIGVFRSNDAGASWNNYSQGLPNTAIYDLRLRTGGNLLRAATHGRGLWEVRVDATTSPTVDIFVRDHVMDDGRAPSGPPVPAGWEDPTRYVALNDPCYWWQCADIKTDAPPDWQLQPSEVDYFNFETKLVHEHPETGNQNRVYVQVHNRGPLPAHDITVKIMTAGASAGLPDLPADFWSTWPNSAGDANWTPVGAPQTIAALEPLRPTVLQWDWRPAPGADSHTCMLVVIDSPSDPIPVSTKAIFDIAQLVTTEKRVGLKNLQLVNLLPDAIHPVPVYLHASRRGTHAYRLALPPLASAGLRADLLFSKTLSRRFPAKRLPKGLKTTKLSAKDLGRLKEYVLKTEMRRDTAWKDFLKEYDTTRQFSVDPRSRGVELELPLKAGGREQIVLLARTSTSRTARKGPPAKLTLIQTIDGKPVGGSTFVFKPAGRR